MKPVIYEVALSVSDYITDDGSSAFDNVREAVEDAKKQAQEDFPNAKAISATFLEIDSPNPAHASAYFDVVMEGVTQEEIDALD